MNAPLITPPMNPLLITTLFCHMLREYNKSYRFVFSPEAIISSIADNNVLSVKTKVFYFSSVEKHYLLSFNAIEK